MQGTSFSSLLPQGQPTDYSGNYIALPVTTLQAPVEGNRSIPVDINWHNDGTPPFYIVHFNAREQQVRPITQICAMHISNLHSSVPVNLYFPDTAFEVQLGPNLEAYYPIQTNGLEFYAYCTLQPVLNDQVHLQVLNYLPPPLILGAAAGGGAVGGVIEVDTGPGLTGGPITKAGTISMVIPVTIADGGTGAITSNGALDNLSGSSGTIVGLLARNAAGQWLLDPLGSGGMPALPLSVVNGGTGASTGFQALDSLAGVAGQTGILERLANGTWNLTVATGTGTITGVVAGPGLAGGGTTGTVTLALQVPLPVADGGTGATAGPAALDNLSGLSGSTLGLVTRLANGSWASVTPLPIPVSSGGTGASAGPAALANLGGAPLASPTFTGVPAAPTAAPGTNTTQLATTAFVTAAFGTGFLPLTGGTLSGPPSTTPLLTEDFNPGVAAPGPVQPGTMLWLKQADNTVVRLLMDGWGTSPAPTVTMRSARGFRSGPTGTLNGDALATFNAMGYSSAGSYSGARASIQFFAIEDFTATGQGTRIQLNTNPAGVAANPVSALSVTNTGLQNFGNYYTFNGAAPGGINQPNFGPYLYGDQNFIIAKLGSGNGGFNLENYAGVAVAGIDNGGNLTVQGGTFGAALHAEASLTVDGSSTFAGAVGMNGTLQVNGGGAAAINVPSGGVTVAGVASLNGGMATTLVTANSVQINGSGTALSVANGNISAGGSLAIGLGATFGGDLGINGHIQVNGGGTAINAPNGNIQTAGELIGASLNIGNGNSVIAGTLDLQNQFNIEANIVAIPDNARACGVAGGAFQTMEAYAFVQVSDAAAKTDIEPLPDCLPLIAAIEPRRYRWASGADTESVHWGFIAQSVEAAMGEAGHDFAGHRAATDDAPAALHHNELLAVLWQANREMLTRIRQLEESLGLEPAAPPVAPEPTVGPLPAARDRGLAPRARRDRRH
jgi:hypothetical protein